MTHRFGKHNIVGNEVGKALSLEFSRKRWSRRKRYNARRRKFWFSALILVIGVAALGALRGIIPS